MKGFSKKQKAILVAALLLGVILGLTWVSRDESEDPETYWEWPPGDFQIVEDQRSDGFAMGAEGNRFYSNCSFDQVYFENCWNYSFYNCSFQMIECRAVQDFNFIKCSFSNWGFGLILRTEGENLVKDCLFENNGYGLRLYGPKTAVVNCTFTGNGLALSLLGWDEEDAPLLVDNHFERNGRNMKTMWSPDDPGDDLFYFLFFWVFILEEIYLVPDLCGLFLFQTLVPCLVWVLAGELKKTRK